MKNITIKTALLCAVLAAGATAFVPPLPTSVENRRCMSSSSSSFLKMGIFDDLKLIFSEEGQKNRAEYENRERLEQEAAQREIMERRRNPQKMADYEKSVTARREKLQEERDAWTFQQSSDNNNGNDLLDRWNQLRAEGKIKAGSDIERDPTSSRLGSAGLQDVRTDDKLPYIDQGYVDEDADVFKNFKNFFGGKKD